MIDWMPAPKAQTTEPWWMALAPLVSFLFIAWYDQQPSEARLLALAWGIDGSLLLTAAIVAWRGRHRPLTSLAAGALSLALVGLTIMSFCLLSPALRIHGIGPFASMLMTGVLAAGLGWLAIQIIVVLTDRREGGSLRRPRC